MMHYFPMLLPSQLNTIQGKKKRLLQAVWNNQGITTHELTNKFIPSNNLHDYSSKVKSKLTRLGWEIKKVPPTKYEPDSCKSWRWFLMPLKENAQDS